MIVFILSLILIGLVGLDRFIYVRMKKGSEKVRFFIGILITGFIFLIAYFITDTAIGVFYAFFMITCHILINIVNNRSNLEWLRCSSHAIGLPLMVYFFIGVIPNILINPRYLILLLAVVNLFYSVKRKWTIKENVALAIGIIISITLIFSYYKLSGLGTRIMVKQELVAQKYLEEELGLNGLEVYVANFSGSTRGEEARLRAYDSSGTVILMTYKNNKIISYDIKKN